MPVIDKPNPNLSISKILFREATRELDALSFKVFMILYQDSYEHIDRFMDHGILWCMLSEKEREHLNESLEYLFRNKWIIEITSTDCDGEGVFYVGIHPYIEFDPESWLTMNRGGEV